MAERMVSCAVCNFWVVGDNGCRLTAVDKAFGRKPEYRLFLRWQEFLTHPRRRRVGALSEISVTVTRSWGWNRTQSRVLRNRCSSGALGTGCVGLEAAPSARTQRLGRAARTRLTALRCPPAGATTVTNPALPPLRPARLQPCRRPCVSSAERRRRLLHFSAAARRERPGAPADA